MHRIEARNAGSRPVKLMLMRPAIDVMAECKAFPRRLRKETVARAEPVPREVPDDAGNPIEKVRNIRG